MKGLREVYIKIDTEINSRIPKEFIEFKDFWSTIKKTIMDMFYFT